MSEVISIESMQQQRCKLQQSSEMINNNNDRNFANNNYEKLNMSRRSSGSQTDSNLSSSSDTEFSQEDNSTSSSSGRSSASQQSLDDFQSLKLASNIHLESEEICELLNSIRCKFLDSLEADQSRDCYDQLDLEELKVQIPVEHPEQSLAFRLISRYVNVSLVDEDCDTLKAVESLRELLKFRSRFELSRAKSDQFSREFYTLSGIFPFGLDKRQIPVLYLRARVHRKWSTLLDESFQRYVAWQINELTKSCSNVEVSKSVGFSGTDKDGSFAICFDCLHVGYSCLDMDFLRYLVKILVEYYPTYCRYALCVDLPWLFRSVWKLVRSWLPEDARNTVQLISSKQLTDFIDEDQIPNCMNVSDKSASEKPKANKHKFPKNWNNYKSIDDYAKELKVTSSELKQFKAHVEKVSKEYLQSGAL